MGFYSVPVALLLLLLLLLYVAWAWEGQLLHEALRKVAVQQGYLNATHWKLPLQKGVMKGQVLGVERHWNHSDRWHSCYTVTCRGNKCPKEDGVSNVVSFCYPGIIITGMPKCGTSAMYDLLTRYSGTIKSPEKENCPYTRRRSHWEFFQSLPRMKDVSPGKLVVDGCLDVAKNLLFRESILRRPKTLYIIMVRNYADMIWSSYNFWCKREYDHFGCDNTRWVTKNMTRSPQLFHDMVLKDLNGTLAPSDSPFHKGPPDMTRPCANAGGYYTEYLDLVVHRSVPRSQTLLLASEQLETQPHIVWAKVSRIMKFTTGLSIEEGGAMGIWSTYSFSLGSFLERRFNPQNAKGGSNSIARKDYAPGVFNISGGRPLMNETRKILDKCWHDDCLKIGKLVGYFGTYPCASEQNLS